MSLKTEFHKYLTEFHKYLKPFTLCLNKKDGEGALAILEKMAIDFGTTYRWKGMVVKYLDHIGPLPDHIHTMMILSQSDDNLKIYLEKVQ